MIYSAALEVLERTGVKIERKEALDLLGDAGARISGNTARIPSYIVEEAVRSAPRKILMHDRNGKPAMRLEDSHFYFGEGSDLPHILDTYTGKFRRFTRKDIGLAAKVADALPEIDFLMSLGLIWDEPVAVTDLHQFQEMLFNSTKPIVFTSHDKRGNQDIIDMASIISGSEEELQQKPFVIHYIEPISPLTGSKESMDKLLLSSEKMIPTLYTPTISAGSTAPGTLAGTITQALAECLSGVTIAQLNRKGAPIIIGGVIGAMDMQTTSFIYGGPDFHLMCAGMNEMAHYVGLPVYGTAGCTDSKVVDEQAAIEAYYSIALQAMSGGNLIHDVGYTGSGLIGNFDMLVMSNEIIGMVRRIMKGINTDAEHRAVDLICKVGPQGNFLQEKHTMDHFRTEHWYPELLDRRNYEKWSGDGSKDMGQRINEKTRSILEEYEPEPLDDAKRKEIVKLVDSEEKSRKVE
jgi:trimethylamine--corrinoid protein Co-methyltransferase